MPKTYALELTADDLLFLEDVVLSASTQDRWRNDYARLQRLIVALDNLRTWA